MLVSPMMFYDIPKPDARKHDRRSFLCVQNSLPLRTKVSDVCFPPGLPMEAQTHPRPTTEVTRFTHRVIKPAKVFCEAFPKQRLHLIGKGESRDVKSNMSEASQYTWVEINTRNTIHTHQRKQCVQYIQYTTRSILHSINAKADAHGYANTHTRTHINTNKTTDMRQCKPNPSRLLEYSTKTCSIMVCPNASNPAGNEWERACMSGKCRMCG